MPRPYQSTPAGRVFGMGLPSWLRAGVSREDLSPSEIEREDMIDAENIQRIKQQDALDDYQRDRQAIATEDAAEAFAEQNPDQLGSLVTKFPGLIRSKNFGNFARVADAAQAQTKAAQSLIPNLRMKMSPEERMHFDVELGKSPQDYMSAYERAQANVERDKQHGELVKAGVPIESIDRTKLYSPFEAASLVQQAAQRKAQINHEQEFDKTMYKLMGEGKFAEMSRAAQLHQDSGHPVGKWAKYADMEPASEVDTLALSRQVGAIDRQIDNLRQQRAEILKEFEGATPDERPALKSKLDKIDAALEESQKAQGEVIRRFDNRTATASRPRRGDLLPTASNISQPSMLNYAEGSHPQEAQESIAGASGFGALPEQGTLAQAMAPNVVLGNPSARSAPVAQPPKNKQEPDTNYQKELENYLPKSEADINKADFNQLSEWVRNPALGEELHAKVMSRIEKLPAEFFPKGIGHNEADMAKMEAIRSGRELAENRALMKREAKQQANINQAWNDVKAGVEAKVDAFVKKHPEVSADMIYRDIVNGKGFRSGLYGTKERLNQSDLHAGENIEESWIPFLLGNDADRVSPIPKEHTEHWYQLNRHWRNLFTNKTQGEILRALADEKVKQAPKKLPAAAPSGNVAPTGNAKLQAALEKYAPQ